MLTKKISGKKRPRKEIDIAQFGIEEEESTPSVLNIDKLIENNKILKKEIIIPLKPIPIPKKSAALKPKRRGRPRKDKIKSYQEETSS